MSCSFTQFIVQFRDGQWGGIFIIGCRSHIKEDWNRRQHHFHSFQRGQQTISSKLMQCWCKVPLLSYISLFFWHNFRNLEWGQTIASKSPMLMQSPVVICYFLFLTHNWTLRTTNHFIEVADVDAKSPSLVFLPRLNLHQVVPQLHLAQHSQESNFF